jgi:MoxR-like ATPase
MKELFQIDWIECPITELSELVDSWKQMYPKMTEAEINHIKETAERLIPADMNFVLEKDTSIDYAKKILLSAKKDQQILLVWPKGTGKTTSIYYLANQTNNPLVPIQLNGATGVDTLVWKWLVNKEWTYWIDGLFTLAWKYWFWIVLDEVNAALPEILMILHPAMDDRRILVLDEKNGEVIQRHPNCRIFGAMNPTEDYAGTKEMNQAFIDRFAGQILVEYPKQEKEIAIILAHKKVTIDNTPPPRTVDGIITRMVKVANSLRKAHKESKLMFECSTRNLIDWACWSSDLSIKEACDLAILSKADPEDKKLIMDEVNKFFKDVDKRKPAGTYNTKKVWKDWVVETIEIEDTITSEVLEDVYSSF